MIFTVNQTNNTLLVTGGMAEFAKTFDSLGLSPIRDAFPPPICARAKTLQVASLFMRF